MSEPVAPQNFIADIVASDLASGRHASVVTRFPPEPNGYLHIGHAKSICLNFGLAKAFGGVCHLRMDDTNPTTEDLEYVEAIKRDVRWLGFEWGDALFFASDYYEQLFEHAKHLVRTGNAYVCSLSEAEVKAGRGSVTEPGTASPYRGRTVEENLDLLERMRQGEFAEGAHVLRAKIDMAAANMKMRDPAIYRIKRAPHYRRGTDWCLFPLYDFTHCLSDAIEGITHSICTLEFENNRELYDWVLDRCDVPCHPRQYEFARLNLSYTMMSKRKLLELVQQKLVRGWDDPRMPTIAGMRRRGYTPEAVRAFCDMIGVAKNNSLVDLGKLEFCLREDLNLRSRRAMCVTSPLRVRLDGAPERAVLTAPWFPDDAARGSRQVPLSPEVFIEHDDFSDAPPPGWHRLALGAEVRLRYAGIIRCLEVERDEAGAPVSLRCAYREDDGKTKVKGTIHWVSAAHAIDAEVRLYDRLFKVEEPSSLDELEPRSLEVRAGCKLEPSLRGAAPGEPFQFERLGYFVTDPDTTAELPVFNRTVTLRDGFAKSMQAAGPAAEPAAPKRARAAQPGASGRERPTIESLKEPARSLAEARRAQGVSEAAVLVLADDPDLGALVDSAADLGADAATAANLAVNQLRGLLSGASVAALPFGARELAELVGLLVRGGVTSTTAKEVLGRLIEKGGSPAALVAELGGAPLADEELATLVRDVIASHPAESARYREGKTALIGFFVGQVMRRAKGQADAALVQQLLGEALAG